MYPPRRCTPLFTSSVLLPRPWHCWLVTHSPLFGRENCVTSRKNRLKFFCVLLAYPGDWIACKISKSRPLGCLQSFINSNPPVGTKLAAVLFNVMPCAPQPINFKESPVFATFVPVLTTLFWRCHSQFLVSHLKFSYAKIMGKWAIRHFLTTEHYGLPFYNNWKSGNNYQICKSPIYWTKTVTFIECFRIIFNPLKNDGKECLLN